MEFEYTYSDKERNIVKSGIDEIKKVLIEKDYKSKSRLLFYLDWYMDPYYKQDLTELLEPLKKLLQELVIIDNEIGIKEEALYLLESYTECPYDILKNNYDKIPEELKSKVLYLINLKN